MKIYKQLIYEQRCQIYALKKIGRSQTAIAELLKGLNQRPVESLNVIQV